MKIDIVNRLQPFSHEPGSICILPGSTLCFKIFPTFLQCFDLSGSVPKHVTDIEFVLTGRAVDFTVQLNLEKGQICVWGHYKEGYVFYRLSFVPEENTFALTLERAPEGGIHWTHLDQVAEKKKTYLYYQSRFTETKIVAYKPHHLERLSLGSHKKLDWCLIKRRYDLIDIIPVLFTMGQLAPNAKPASGGTCELLDILHEAINHKDKQALEPLIKRFLAASFNGILSPRLKDSDYHGFHLSDQVTGSPLFLLSESYRLIRKLFLTVKESTIEILPVLAPQFNCGRLKDVRCEKFGLLDLEWSKKKIRRMIFKSFVNREIFFKFPEKTKKYRLRTEKSTFHIEDTNQAVPLAEGCVYYFDNFQK